MQRSILERKRVALMGSSSTYEYKHFAIYPYIPKEILDETIIYQAYGIDRECIIGIAYSNVGEWTSSKEKGYPYRSSILFMQDRIIMFHKPESTEHEYYNMDDLDIIQKCSKTCMYNEIRENYEEVFQGLKFLKISKEDLAKLCKDLDKAKDDKSVKETNQMLIDKLTEMEKTIQDLEKRISKLEAKE